MTRVSMLDSIWGRMIHIVPSRHISEQYHQRMMPINFVIHTKPHYHFTVINNTKSIYLNEKIGSLSYWDRPIKQLTAAMFKGRTVCMSYNLINPVFLLSTCLKLKIVQNPFCWILTNWNLITAIPRQLRFCQTRVSNIRGFPFVFSFAKNDIWFYVAYTRH